MACYFPIRAYQGADGSVFFRESVRTDSVRTLELPCGRCVGCRLERSRQWAIRCVHEASLQEDNCYITLTYEVNPVTLVYSDFQLFMKRLRRFFSPVVVRFFMCGEYGELNLRPHFHACLFGAYFRDRVLFSQDNGFNLYTSADLTKLWPLGFSTVGDVSFQSAAYVARYLMKKVTGDDAKCHYRYVVAETGEVIERLPEFAHMSLKPGIGARWLDKYQSDVYPTGEMVINGVQCKPPKYYDRRFKKLDEDAHTRMSFERESAGKRYASDNTDARLAVREKVAKAKVGLLKRPI